MLSRKVKSRHSNMARDMVKAPQVQATGAFHWGASPTSWYERLYSALWLVHYPVTHYTPPPPLTSSSPIYSSLCIQRAQKVGTAQQPGRNLTEDTWSLQTNTHTHTHIEIEYFNVSAQNLLWSDHYLLTFEYLLINYKPRVTNYYSTCISENTV